MEHELPPPTNDPVVLTPLIVPEREGIRLQHLMYAVVVCALLLWLAMLAKYWLIVIVIVGGVGLAVAAAVILARRNASRQESLLWAMAIASERSMPLSPAVLAFADQFGASFRWRVELLASLLDEGKSLPEACEQVPGLFSREALVMIRAGWATGTLPAALKQAATLRATSGKVLGGVASRLAYLLSVLLAMQVVTMFIIYFIAPKLQAIFYDFGIELPRMTTLTIQASSWASGPIGLLLVPLVLGELLALLLLLFGAFDFFQWEVPLIDGLFRRRHSALLLRSLALTIEGQRPIGKALDALSEEYPSAWARKRLRKAAFKVSKGGDWALALYEQGLIRRSDAALLLSAQRVGNLPWALREAAAATERRLGHRLRVLSEVLFPVAIVLMGLLVFVFAVAYFYPLVILIERLAG